MSIWHWRYSPAVVPREGSGAPEISPASALHSHEAAEAPVAQAHFVTAATAVHDHGADPVSLAQTSSIMVASARHGLNGDALAPTQFHILWPQDGVHAVTSPGAGIAGAVLAVPPDRLYVPPRRHDSLRPAADERLTLTEK